MNEESRPVRRLPGRSSAVKPNTHPGGDRAWERDVRMLSDEDLMLVVRAQIAVDRAVNTYRTSAAAPISFDVPKGAA
jgi:hypothetical protein